MSEIEPTYTGDTCMYKMDPFGVHTKNKKFHRIVVLTSTPC